MRKLASLACVVLILSFQLSAQASVEDGFPKISEGKLIYGENLSSPAISRFKVSDAVVDIGDDFVRSRTPGCPRIDLVPNKGLTAVKVNDKEIGDMENFKLTDKESVQSSPTEPLAYFAKHEEIQKEFPREDLDPRDKPKRIPKIPKCKQDIIVPFFADIESKRIYVGSEAIGTFTSFNLRKELLRKDQLGKEGIDVSLPGNLNVNQEKPGNKSLKKSEAGDKPVKEKIIVEVVKFGLGIGNAVGAGVGIFLKPSQTGCAALHGC